MFPVNFVPEECIGDNIAQRPGHRRKGKRKERKRKKAYKYERSEKEERRVVTRKSKPEMKCYCAKMSGTPRFTPVFMSFHQKLLRRRGTMQKYGSDGLPIKRKFFLFSFFIVLALFLFPSASRQFGIN
ncbi:hypothetical protein L873DRAFT_1005741 [Choiromyces venosus 120613-1]|uniref:Transmembrane protein n=1 Tax=Choiromyces venosus 120613-1 TaxID=1336337 RepID=A0A3N4JPG2_9PEZI|nr:hypothetical protein L873DRAFT_1005741 [Choiromyces venosus 120613-1]